jgi:hypothetical protein
MTMDAAIIAVAGDRPEAAITSYTIGFPMGQLRTANKRRNRALARATAKPAVAAAPAPAKAVKPKKSATA